MTKEALAMGGTERDEAARECVLQIIQVAGGTLPKVGFEFGEGHFDGIEIRTVRRQIADRGPAS